MNFLRHAATLGRRYKEAKRRLHAAYGKPSEVVDWVLSHMEGEISEVVVHRDMTPYAMERDREIRNVCDSYGIIFTQLTDHLLVDLKAFATFTGKSEPYKVFAAFHRRWVEFMNEHPNPPSAITIAEVNVTERNVEWPEVMRLPGALLENSDEAGMKRIRICCWIVFWPKE